VSAAYVDRASPRALPQPAATVAAALAVLGIACFLYGLATDPATAWRAFHVNTLYFGGLAQGGIIIACIFTIVGARWPGPVRRLAEGLGAFVPITFVLSLVGYLGRNHVYPWIGHPPPGKEAWLDVTRLYATDWAIFLLLAVLSVMFLRASLRPALKDAEGEATGFAGRMAASWTSGWRGDEAER
jgi:Ni/Fe-hydrogenase subunit HybB-like protein